MDNVKLSPVLKWAGGKTQLLGKLMNKVPLHFNMYFEPFIGGGAFLLNLRPQNAVINDINEQLINMYQQLKYHVSDVISAIKLYDEVDCDVDFYLKIRADYNQKILARELDAECAAMMIWLNKHCFNGLYRVNSRGLFNVPYNNKKRGESISANNLMAISQYLREANIEIYHEDFEHICEKVQHGDFVYFDSPYIPVSETANFTDYAKDGFSYEDHKRLADLFHKLDDKGAFLMLSNNNVPLVHKLYDGFNIEIIDVRRNINRDSTKRFSQEVIITNYTK